ncbi:bromodomain and WD repeat-containing protein 3-like [Ornithodoros turicata]|uniref:bromodomain and WD repeat-containing protein 3-like n=1 Tax=Ornithodoros turicata TaxID=34597 RepID=UPI003139A567
MSNVVHNISSQENIEKELYFLISKFLSNGPCTKAAEALRREIEENHLLPKRIDWLGNEHHRSFSDLERANGFISADYLLRICSRVGPLLDQLYPTGVAGSCSLLGSGNYSLLRQSSRVRKVRTSCDATVRRHGAAPCLPPGVGPPNIAMVLQGRSLNELPSASQQLSIKFFAKAQLFRRLLGHLSSVYCCLFDRSGYYIFTGADDLLVKIWCATDGRLLATLRGHSAEITDLAVSPDNGLLAAGSCDKVIRVWCLQTLAPVAVLLGHTAMVTSLRFCPYPKGNRQFLVSTGNDGCVLFWDYSSTTKTFNHKPLKFVERSRAGAQMVCSSFSPGGTFLATGSTDHMVRVYYVLAANGPERIAELETHTDQVDSLQFANHSCRFVSGSKDGTANIWSFERQQWRAITLKMATKLIGTEEQIEEDPKQKLKVTMVGWSLDDKMVITAITDYSIKAWDSNTGKLIQTLTGHEDEVFVLESHPVDSRILLSGGHDGRIVLWDLMTGTMIRSFFNMIEGQGHGAVFDCKFSPDGLLFASTDSHGHISIFGFGSSDPYKKVPDEQFFHTDYRPVIRDANQHVLDEQTQSAPHLMPPPFLVDIDGNPYPPALQRLVPGRGRCLDSQLVPYVAVLANGEAEILEPVMPNGNEERGMIDEMIQILEVQQARLGQQQQQQPQEAHGSLQSPARPSHRASITGHSPGPHHSRVGMRRTGDVEGVRQSSGNWQSRDDTQQGPSQVPRPARPGWIVRPLPPGLQQSADTRAVAMARREQLLFVVESHRRRQNSEAKPPAENVLMLNSRHTRKAAAQKSKAKSSQTRSTRSAPSNREDPEDAEEVTMSSTTDTNAVASDSSESSSSESDDSEWSETPKASKKPSATKTSKRVPRAMQRQEAEDYDTIDSGDTDENEDSGDFEDEADVSESEKKTVENGDGGGRRTRAKAKNSDDDYSDGEQKRKSARNRERKRQRKKQEARAPPGGGSSRRRCTMATAKDEIAEQSTESASPERPSAGPSSLPPTNNKSVLRPPDWLTDVFPRRTPYFPQVGDEVVYFHQGHQAYVQVVKRCRAYKVKDHSQPWVRHHIREQELVKVLDIKFELCPPHLCCLKVQPIDPSKGLPDGDRFVIRYHDMPDVIDFLVLRQTYDHAMRRNWKPGDRFRSIIDDAWWMGTINAQSPLQPEFPDSMFQCFTVTWDNGEAERMSPWDFERIDPCRLPENVGGAVPVTHDERQSLIYRPRLGEWPRCGRDAFCDRLVQGIDNVMELSIAEPFSVPVDLNAYPMYARVVAYPMDLTTIRTRLENRFYRRAEAVKFDIRFIEVNAKKFNEPQSKIVQKAVLLVRLLSTFLDDHSCRDVIKLYQKLVESNSSAEGSSRASEQGADSSGSSDVEVGGSSSAWSGSKRKKAMPRRDAKRLKAGVPAPICSSTWKTQCSNLLNLFFECEDSTPFRQPVDINVYTNYLDIIDHPVDLSTVRDRLQSNRYPDPMEFCKDMRLIFANSRNYNTNKKSRIYSMTIRLSAMFEERIRSIVSDWRSAVKYEAKVKNNQYVSQRRHPANVEFAFQDAQPSSSRSSARAKVVVEPVPTVRAAALRAKKYMEESDSLLDESDDECESNKENSRVNGTRPVRVKAQDNVQVNDRRNRSTKMCTTRPKRSQRQRQPPPPHRTRSASSSEKELVLESRLRKRKATQKFTDDTTDDDDDEESEDAEDEEDEEQEDENGECNEDGEENGEQENDDDDDEEYKDDEEDDVPPRRKSTRRAARTNVIGSDDSSTTSSIIATTRTRSRTRVVDSDHSEDNAGSSRSSGTSVTFVTDHDYGMPRRSSRTPRPPKTFETEKPQAPKGRRVETRNRGHQTVRYREEEEEEASDDDDDDDDNDGLDCHAREVLSVSSRGRLRKLSKHATRAMVAQ